MRSSMARLVRRTKRALMVLLFRCATHAQGQKAALSRSLTLCVSVTSRRREGARVPRAGRPYHRRAAHVGRSIRASAAINRPLSKRNAHQSVVAPASVSKEPRAELRDCPAGVISWRRRLGRLLLRASVCLLSHSVQGCQSVTGFAPQQPRPMPLRRYAEFVLPCGWEVLGAGRELRQGASASASLRRQDPREVEDPLGPARSAPTRRAA